MSLKMKYEDGLDTPVVVCDHCGHEITDAADGNYAWLVNECGLPVGDCIHYTHKECHYAFEQARGGEWYAMPLEAFPVYIARRLRVNQTEAEAKADYFSLV